MKEVENTIELLENGATTFDTCQKLASLYIVRNMYADRQNEDIVEQELSDILPMYQRYVKVKTRYQKHEVTEEMVIMAMENVCKEIKEFIQTIYKCTDTSKERELLLQMLSNIKDVVI